ncbi:hypothetical protein [Streptomyces sp. NPDC048248]|uniref:hypothetical protein n=1 Tax=Streptomyces sp. NPDC048248 TaxID=3365523 RepID=UPI003722E15C
MTLPMENDPDFWTQIMTLREPAYSEPTEDDVLALQDDIFEAVQRMASAISLRDQDYRAAGVRPAPAAVVASPDYQLATLHALRQAEGVIETFAATSAKNAGHTGASYTKLGAAWGITRQSARLKWPDAARKPGARPVELDIAGGRATVTQLSDDDGYVWEATAENGVTEHGQEPYGSIAEAAAHAGAFLQRHAYDPSATHGDCTEPHRDSKGEYVDCDGQPV